MVIVLEPNEGRWETQFPLKLNSSHCLVRAFQTNAIDCLALVVSRKSDRGVDCFSSRDRQTDSAGSLKRAGKNNSFAVEVK